MKILDDIKGFLQYNDMELDENYDYNEYDSHFTQEEDMTFGEIQTVMRGDPAANFIYDKEKISEEEKKHCLKLYEMAKAFDKLDAATVMCVLCQTHMDVVMSAVMNEITEMRETLDKYKEVGK